MKTRRNWRVKFWCGAENLLSRTNLVTPRASYSIKGVCIDPHQEKDKWLAFEHIHRYEIAREKLSGRILDVCCGAGYGTSILSQKHDVVGIDISQKAIKWARKHYCCLDFLRADVLSMPFANCTFDGVVCNEGLEHVTDPYLLIKEVFRVLRPSGKLFLTTPNNQSIRNKILGTAETINIGHVKEYSIPEVKTFLNKSGFTILEVNGAGLLPIPHFRFLVKWIGIQRLNCFLGSIFPSWGYDMYILAMKSQ